MEDNFLKNSKAMSSNSNPVLALRKAALAAMPKARLRSHTLKPGVSKKTHLFYVDLFNA